MAEKRPTTLTGADDPLGRWLRRYAKGELLAVEGQESRTFIILKRGIVGIYKDGQRVTAVDEPGSYLGEMAYLLGTPRTASMKAETDVEAYVMPAETFDTILEEAPQIRLKVMAALASRLRSTTSENAVQRRQINRMRTGGAAPDIHDSHDERAVDAYATRAMGEVVFLLRTLLHLRGADPAVESVLSYALLTDLVAANAHHVPPREHLTDLVKAVRGEEKGRLVDLRHVVATVRGTALTPKVTPEATSDAKRKAAGAPAPEAPAPDDPDGVPINQAPPDE